MSAPITAGALGACARLESGIEVVAGCLRLRIEALRPDILRLRATLAGGPWDEWPSFAVLPEARQARLSVQSIDTEDTFGFKTDALRTHIERTTGRLRVSAPDGRILHADAPDLPMQFQNGGFTLFKTILPEETYFGLGDKPGPLVRNGRAFTFWTADPHNYQESTDPIYKSIPFALGVTAPRAQGILLDNTYRSHFDFGKRHRDVLEIDAEAGPLDLYLIFGQSPKAVLKSYRFLTGAAPLPPLWSFGHQQSRYSYMSAEEVRAVAQRFRTERFPNDVIYLDIDFQDRFRTFTTDPERFSDLAGLVSDLDAIGTRVVAIADAPIAVVEDGSYATYGSGLAGDHFLRDRDGGLFVGPMWGGHSAYPDFARQATRLWWAEQQQPFLTAGIAGLWNDMNEPVVFGPRGPATIPLDMPHRVEEPDSPARSADHAEIHNVYGLLNTRATFEGMRAFVPSKRPYVLTRSTFAGGQRTATTWTGDNSATWHHLRLGIAMLVNLGLSGFPFAGADLGGFFGSAPAELLTRWYQIGAFTPMFRNHAFQDTLHREPWLDGEPHLSIRRRFTEIRYRLLPYLYTLAEEASRSGVPPMRPLFLEFPETAHTGTTHRCDPFVQFMLGQALMIAPAPFAEFRDSYTVRLPGGAWYDYWSGERLPADPANPQRTKAPEIRQCLETIPVFARSGTIIPHQPLVQSTAERPAGLLELRIYPGANAAGTVYWDEGDGYGYQTGGFTRIAISLTSLSDGYDLHVAPREGNLTPWWSGLRFVLHDVPRLPTAIDGPADDIAYDAASRRLSFSILGALSDIRLRLRV